MSYITIRRIIKAFFHPKLGLEYLKYKLWRGLRLHSGAKVGAFLNFNEYLGTAQNQPTETELSFIDSILCDDCTVFDIGANIGVFSLGVLSKKQHAVAYCFEPSLINFNRLSDNIQRNGYTAFLHCVALASPDAPNSMAFSADVSSPSTMHFAEKGDTAVIQVKVTALDDFCASNHISKIDLLKIDVEGYETDVLSGAHELLKNAKIENIMIEVCPHNLKRAGFSVPLLWKAWNDVHYTAYRIPQAANEALTPVTLEECMSFDCENILLKPISRDSTK